MLRKILLILGGAAILAGLAGAVMRAQRLPDGPVPVAWNQEACAHCAMHVGEPHFAAQLQTEDGQVLDFDDPGCLLAWEAEHHPSVHAIWFHHLREDRWIPASAAAFVPVDGTPMGWGLGAVDSSTPGALGGDEARARVAARQASRRAP